jgi:hypothetical protein
MIPVLKLFPKQSCQDTERRVCLRFCIESIVEFIHVNPEQTRIQAAVTPSTETFKNLFHGANVARKNRNRTLTFELWTELFPGATQTR